MYASLRFFFSKASCYTQLCLLVIRAHQGFRAVFNDYLPFDLLKEMISQMIFCRINCCWSAIFCI